ncbi:glycine--tRNA ligase [Dietzia aurantiaca]
MSFRAGDPSIPDPESVPDTLGTSARAPARAEVIHPDTSANRLTKGRTPDVAASASVIDTVVNLCKRRGLVYQSGEIYGGTRSAWDYGPLGAELKENIKRQWWRTFVTAREDVVGLDSSIILPRRVWEASGHVETFTDPLVECMSCHTRLRQDHLQEAYAAKKKLDDPADAPMSEIACPNCGTKGKWTEPQLFSGLVKTYLGPVDNEEGLHYLRPETAQGIFVNYKNVMTTARRKPPFGIGQIGKAFRNEITPGNFIFRTREFEQMEIEFFTKPDEAPEWFDRWVEDCWNWFVDLGIDPDNLRRFDVPQDERAHYSARTIDFEYKFGFQGNEWGELMGIANRTDYDLSQHQKHSGEDLQYFDQATGEKYIPYVIEPSFGLTRSLMAFLVDAYTEDEAPNAKGGVDTRTVLKLDRRLSPFKAAVLPLSRNADLSPRARDLAAQLRKNWNVDFDDAQAIGRRYRRHDEIGTPFCITVDFDTLEDQAVTIRERDTMAQERVAIDQVEGYLAQRLIGC